MNTESLNSAHFLRYVLSVLVDQVMLANPRTQGNKRRIDLSLEHRLREDRMIVFQQSSNKCRNRKLGMKKTEMLMVEVNLRTNVSEHRKIFSIDCCFLRLL